jgi:alpha-D-ribose 1-methylphosphonate 5-triphosphate synthase subunit PhnH
MQREIQYDTVFDAQEHYRLLLDAMARPGEIRVLPAEDLTPPPGIHGAAALVGFALLNTDASFCTVGDEEVSRYLAVHTSAPVAVPEEADFIFIGSGADADDIPGLIAQAKRGTLPYPEEGATLVLSVEELSAGQPAGAALPEGQPAGSADLTLALEGPGVKTINYLHIKGVHTDVLSAWRAQNEEFPLGIDLILADRQGRIAAVPRSSKVTW